MIKDEKNENNKNQVNGNPQDKDGISTHSKKPVVTSHDHTVQIQISKEIIGVDKNKQDPFGQESRFQEFVEQKKKELSNKQLLLHGPLGKAQSLISSKKKIGYIIIIILLGFLFLYDTSDNKVQKIKVKIPYAAKELNEEKAELARVEGDKKLNSFNSGEDVLIGINEYQKSIQFQYNENPSWGRLLFLYSTLLPDYVFTESSNLLPLYKIHQVLVNTRVNDLYATLGSVNILSHFEMNKGAIKVIEDFIRVNSRKEGSKSFSLGIDEYSLLQAQYLILLTQEKNFSQARKIFEFLSQSEGRKRWNGIVYYSQVKYLIYSQREDEYLKYLEKGNKANPKYWDFFSRSLLLNDIVEHPNLLGFESTKKTLNSLTTKGMDDFSSLNVIEKYLVTNISFLIDSLSSVENSKNSNEFLWKSEYIKFLHPNLKGYPLKLYSDLLTFDLTRRKVKNALGLLKNENFDKATLEILSAKEINPELPEIFLTLGLIQYKGGLVKNAIDTLEEGLRSFPLSVPMYSLIVKIYLEQGRVSEAKTVLDRIIKTSSLDNEELDFLYARFFKEVGDINNGIRWVTKAINKNPLRSDYYSFLGEMFFLGKRLDKARSYFGQCLDINPSERSCQVGYAKVLYELEGTDTAIGYLRSLLEVSPNDGLLLGQIAMNYYRSGQTKKYEDSLTKVLNLSSKDPDIYEFLVETHLMENKIKESVAYAKELAGFSGAKVPFLMNLCSQFLSSNYLNEAKEILDIIERNYQNLPKLNYFLGRFYQLSGNIKNAETYAEKEILLNSAQEFGFLLRGDLFVIKEDYPAAEEYYLRAQAINSNSSDSIIGLSRVRMGQRRFGDAIELLNKVLKRDTSNGISMKLLGMCYMELGQKDLAKESFKNYLELNPLARDKAEVEQLLNRI